MVNYNLGKHPYILCTELNALGIVLSELLPCESWFECGQ